MKFILLSFFLTSCLWADQATIPDGAWNGKPWKKSILLKEVAKGNPNALAEWAYCSRRALLQIPFDKKLIYQRAQQAASQKSLIGARLVAKCLMHGVGTEPDPQKAKAMFKDLARQGCPDAILDMAGIHIYTTKEYAKAEALIQQAEKFNCIRSLGLRASLAEKKESSPYDSRKAVQLRIKDFKLNRDIYSACSLHYIATIKRPGLYHDIISPELLNKIFDRVEQGATLNHPTPLFRQSWYELKKRDKHLGVTLMIRAANAGNPDAMKSITKWISQGLEVRQGNSNELLAIGEFKTGAKAAEFAYHHGIRTDTVLLSYATELSRFHRKGYAKKHQLATELFRRILKNGDCNAHDPFGIQHIQNHEIHQGTQEDSNRGFAHLIYHTNHSDYACHTLALYYMSEPDSPSYNLPKGIATCKNTISRQDGQHRKDMERWIKQESKLTEEQKAELKQLTKDGFPTAEKFRRPAFKLIQASGDLPDYWKFGQQYDNK